MAQRSSHLESGGMDFKLILPFVANTVKRILARRAATLRVESNRRFYTLKKEHDPKRTSVSGFTWWSGGNLKRIIKKYNFKIIQLCSSCLNFSPNQV